MKSLLFGSFFIVVVFFQDWIVQPIDTRVSVSFPVKPIKQMLGNEPYFTAVSEDGFSCTAMVTDYSKGAPDTASLAAYMASPAAMHRPGNLSPASGGASLRSISSRPISRAAPWCRT